MNALSYVEARLKQSDLWVDFCADVASRISHDCNATKAKWETLKAEPKYGWIDLQNEKTLAGDPAPDAAPKKETEKSAEKAFVDAIRKLPSKVDDSQEFAWVQSHPAFSRRARMGDDQVVRVSLEDITKAPNGRCPSQAAANLLIHSVNDPEKVMRAILSVMQRSKPAETVTAAESEADLERVDHLKDLRELCAKYADADL